MRIRVCIPFYAEFEAAKPGLAELKACTEHKFVIEPRRGTLIYRIRNSLINDGMSTEKKQKPVPGFEAFLDIDSDISFTLEDVLVMIAHNKDSISLPYLKQGEEVVYEAGWFTSTLGDIGGRYGKETVELKKVGYTGGGMRLTKAHVYEKMDFPWYGHPLIQKGDCQDYAAEDIGFCLNAKANGFDIWCDFNRPVEHKIRTHSQFNWDINGPKNLIQRYYRESLIHQTNAEKSLSQVLAVAETMGWTPEETNKILGSIVIAPAIENKSNDENLIKKGI